MNEQMKKDLIVILKTLGIATLIILAYVGLGLLFQEIGFQGGSSTPYP